MPRWSGGKRLVVRMVLTLEKEQHELLKERAHQARMDVTEYIRSVLFPPAPLVKAEPPVPLRIEQGPQVAKPMFKDGKAGKR